MLAKRLIITLFLIIALVRVGGYFGQAGRHNQAAVVAVAHLSGTRSCAADQPYWQWQGVTPTSPPSPYLQAVLAGALDTELVPPSFVEWQRDPRLFYWFAAQHAAKNGDYSESLRLLQQSRAGSMLDATAHMAARAGRPECSLINWTLASEIGYGQSPDGYRQHMMNHRQWMQVAVAFERLLMYDANRVEWRISLARAYLALQRATDAEYILAPVIANGTLEEKNEAARLLQTITP
jgi:hypothetical protein